LAHDVFISHSAKDKAVADAVCATLEGAGIRCWMAPRDILPSADWGASIIDAIEGSRLMVLIFSSHSNQSEQVKREIQNAVQEGVAILPLRIEDVPLTKSLRYFLSSVHWLDALTPPLEAHLKGMCAQIQALLGVPSSKKVAEAAVPPADLPDARPAIGARIRERGGDSTKELTLDLGRGVQIRFVLIPAGKFLMGSPDREKARLSNEGPQLEVTISKQFYMGVYEVTQEQYEAVMGTNPSGFKGSKFPVEQVSWDDAVEFCKKLSVKTGKTVRLPTEAEWEYACRAGSNARFCFGDDDSELGGYAWYGDNSDGKTHPVGEKKPNVFGLYDMHGNILEWCRDWYAKSYESPTNVDPIGPDSGTDRVLRGGCWGVIPALCRSAFRNARTPKIRSFNFGFRVVVSGVE